MESNGGVNEVIRAARQEAISSVIATPPSPHLAWWPQPPDHSGSGKQKGAQQNDCNRIRNAEVLISVGERRGEERRRKRVGVPSLSHCLIAVWVPSSHSFVLMLVVGNLFIYLFVYFFFFLFAAKRRERERQGGLSHYCVLCEFNGSLWAHASLRLSLATEENTAVPIIVWLSMRKELILGGKTHFHIKTWTCVSACG